MKIIHITGETKRCSAMVEKLMQERTGIEVHGDYQHDKIWLGTMIEKYRYSIKATNLTSSDLTHYCLEPR